MTDLTVAPTVETILVAHYRSIAQITDITTAIGTATVPDGPCLRITRIPGGRLLTAQVAYADVAHLQIDAYGAPHEPPAPPDEATAEQLAQLARAAMTIPVFGGRHAGGVISDSVPFGFGSDPDSSVTPARARYLFQALVTAHP